MMTKTPEATPHSALLEGIRILDLTRVMSGPYCTAMLADLGAEVIKIELPEVGDSGRHFAPYVGEDSVYFALLNRGKKSVTVDLKHPDGVALVKRLAGVSDVLVENFRPGVMERLGLAAAPLQSSHPGLVYASISGFGKSGPYAKWPAFDLVIQAMGGLMSITGQRDGPPTAVGESLADVCTGMFGAFGILAALFERQRTGRGQHVDVAMLDSVFSMLITGWSRRLFTDRGPQRLGNRHPETYPVDSVPTRDGDIVFVCFSDTAFAGLCRGMGCPELATDPRFASNAARNENEHELRAAIVTWSSARNQAEVLAILQREGVPCAPVWTFDELLASGHVEARNLITRGRHARLGDIPLVPQPVRFSGRGSGPSQESPLLGQHTDEVLSEILGMDDAVIAELHRREVLG